MANEYGFHQDRAIYLLSELLEDLLPQIREEVGDMILDKAYPVGSVYISLTDDDPSETLGGEWEQIEDRFLLAAGENHLVTDEPGGEEEVLLTAAECGVPPHTHPNNLGFTVNSHSHGQDGKTIRWYASINKGKKPSGGNTGHFVPALSAAQTDNSWQVTIASGGNAIRTAGSTATTSKSGGVQSNASLDAASAHNNMPPYIVVYMWRRVA